jgi:glycosyltransferase involved in cell wall biosynthesis
LDNASTDGTSELIEDYCKQFPNIKHIKHNINIGGNANICRAFEMSTSCGKEYAWILCDDDRYDFSNWSEVEQKTEEGKDLICVSDYAFSKQGDKTNKAFQIFQMTFVPATIFKTENITDGVLMNMYDSILTMFQQSCLTIHVINNNGQISVLDKPIVHNGLHFEENINLEDVSYTRGNDDDKEILEQRKNTCWVLGFSRVISLLKDKKLRYECMEAAIPYKDIYGYWANFYNCLIRQYFNFHNFQYFYEILMAFNIKRRVKIILNTILGSIFYIYKCENKGYYIRLFNILKTKILPLKH